MGIGKTSVMRMVKHKIDQAFELDDNVDTDANCKRMYFNTWEFSQFNLSNNISIVTLKCILNIHSISNKSITRR